jgi:hypothetical protein
LPCTSTFGSIPGKNMSILISICCTRPY